MEPNTIFWSLFSFYCLVFLWDLYLSYRQYRVHLINEKRPEHVAEIISEEDYTKARAYKLDKHRFGFVEAIFSKIEITVVLLFNVLPYLWNLTGNWSRALFDENEICHSIVFFWLSSLIEVFIGLPFNYYDTLVIEQKHGFNKQTVNFFFVDQLKKLVISFIITTPIIVGVIWIINIGGKFFFVYVWFFLFIVIFVIMTIYPEFIAPLFDKYIPLPQSQLKDKIEELASRLNYPLKKLFVVQGSKRSAHSNAYMYGFWNNKRIVLYDTLLSEELNEDLKAILDTEKPSDSKLLIDKKDDEMTEGESSFNSFENNEPKTNEETKKNKKLGMNDDEVVAVLGHELGHWKLWHSFYNLVIMEINSFILLAVFAYFYRQESIYAAFGFVNQPPIIGLLLIMQFVMLPYNEVVSVIMSFHSRYAEFAADKFSADLGYTDLLCSALIKLGKDNLSLPIDDPLYSAIHHSHPPTPERIAALQKNK